MAKKLKVFASGEVLTAEDVNKYLNPPVPDAATVYDTGWINLPLINGWAIASGQTPQARRVGLDVELRGRVSGGSGSVTTLPEDFRPSRTANRIVREGALTTSVLLTIGTDGSLNPAAGTGQINLDCRYLAD